MVFFCSENIALHDCNTWCIHFKFKTFSKSQHKVEGTKWAYPPVAGLVVAFCWITGVPITLALMLFSLVSCETVMGLVITVINTGCFFTKWEMMQSLADGWNSMPSTAFWVEKLYVSFGHWCCLWESKRLLTPPEVKFWRHAHLQIVHANAGNWEQESLLTGVQVSRMIQILELNKALHPTSRPGVEKLGPWAC